MRAKIIGLIAVLAIFVGAIYLWTPAAPTFDRKQALVVATAYDVRIVRDSFGVPHIFGQTDADVAFGLAYAQSEDDMKTLEEVLWFSRGKMAERLGKSGAITDYLIVALGVNVAIVEKYEHDLSTGTRKILDGYAAGVNLFCAEKKSNCANGTAPITSHDIVAGFVSRTPFFYGLDGILTKLFEGDKALTEMAIETREAFLNLDRGGELGSNAMAVAPSKTPDNHTRLMVNSHQPFTGPVAWYEARLKSEEGWDMIGSLFPGAPLILHGAGPTLGWAFTVNHPDLVDIYKLETNKNKNPTQYKFDGDWKDFTVERASFRVKLVGPFSLPVNRNVLRSVHGPVFDTPDGFFAVSFAGDGDIRAVEQWFQMNKAASRAEWKGAMALQAIPSFNIVYADNAGNISYTYNVAIPKRSPDWDWFKTAPGDRADLVWDGVEPFGTAPSVENPQSGYVVNANHTPFQSTGAQDNPKRDDFPAHYGIPNRETNRGLRLQELFSVDPEISSEEFLSYKWDNNYAVQSRLMEFIAALTDQLEDDTDPEIQKAVTLLRSWDGSTAIDQRAAGLAIRTGQLVLGGLLDERDAQMTDPVEALRITIKGFQQGFGRIDPTWGEVNRLRRGKTDLALNGGPDVLRAIYALDDPKDGPYMAMAGDTYILYADWPLNGAPSIKTIHQFGSATLDEKSPHYDDQAPLFAEEILRSPPMTLEAVLQEATADYHPGKKPR